MAKKEMTLEAIRAIYDGFENKDMPFEQFACEMAGLLDPKKAMDDLADIELMKARERSGRARIDKAVGR